MVKSKTNLTRMCAASAGCLKRRSNVKAAARDSSDSSCEQKTGLKLLQSLSTPIFSAAAAMQVTAAFLAPV